MLLLLFASAAAFAFEPGDGPPPTKTLSWTVRFASHTTIPKIRYKNETPQSVARHMLGVLDLPPEYTITIDTSRLHLSDPAVISFEGDNMTLLEALSRVAQQVHANLLIKAGSIVLEPQ